MVKQGNVAIIGAGLSGLACAFELQKKGIVPEIFEKTTLIGENLELPAVILKMFNSPIRDPLKYLKKHYDISLAPHYNINEFKIVTPNKTTTITGHVGWIFRRGSFEGSMNDQIRKLISAPITLDAPKNFRDMKSKYNHVVIASGSLSEAEEMNMLQLTYNSFARIATVEGKFSTDSVTIWLNTEYAKNSYAYIVPDTETRAKLVLIVNGIKNYELDMHWEKFLNTEKLQYKIVKTFDTNYKVGSCNTVQMGNLYFTGFAGGFIDDVMGIGAPYAIISGVSAARAIIENKNYTKIMRAFEKDVKKKHVLRQAMDLAGNQQFDKLNNFLDNQLVKVLTYKNPLFRAAHITPFVGLYTKIKQKKTTMQQNQNNMQGQSQSQPQGQSQNQGQGQGSAQGQNMNQPKQ